MELHFRFRDKRLEFSTGWLNHKSSLHTHGHNFTAYFPMYKTILYFTPWSSAGSTLALENQQHSHCQDNTFAVTLAVCLFLKEEKKVNVRLWQKRHLWWVWFINSFFSFIAGTLKYTISLSSAMSCACSCWCTEDLLQVILHFKRSNFR